MAKRTAAGTLALAVCLSGGIAFAGAANAALPAAAALASVSGSAPTIFPGSSTQAAADITVALDNTLWADGDQIRVELPANVTFASAPSATVAAVTAGGKTYAPTVTAKLAKKTVDNDMVLVTFSGATPKDAVAADSDLKLVISNVKLTAASALALGNVTAAVIAKDVTNTSTGALGADKAYGSPVIATAQNGSISTSAGQTLTTDGGAQSIDAITITEGQANAFADGDYVLTFSNATVADIKADGFPDGATFTAGAGSSAAMDFVSPASTSITQDVTNQVVTVKVKGLSATVKDSFTISGLKVTPAAKGAVQVAFTSTPDPDGVGPLVPAVTGSPKAPAITAYTPGVRVGGLDRYQTAANIATQVYTDTTAIATDTVIVTAGGMGTPTGASIDALSAAYLAGAQAQDTPIVLTDSSFLPLSSESAIKKVLGAAGNVIIVGGTTAVNTDVEKAIKALDADYVVTRISGSDRYDSAARAAVAAGAATAMYQETASSTNLTTAIIASGVSPVDALAAGQVSYRSGVPLLLTEKSSVPQVTFDAISALGIKQVFILGGTAAISDTVKTQLEESGVRVIRVDGADRYETAANFLAIANAPVAPTATTKGGFNAGLKGSGTQALYLASGTALADATVAGPLAAVKGSALLLSPAGSLDKHAAAFIKAQTAVVDVAGIGLATALPTATLNAANIAANS